MVAKRQLEFVSIGEENLDRERDNERERDIVCVFMHVRVYV